MSQAVDVPQVGKSVDSALKAINSAEDANNNGKIIYIRHGELAFDTYDNLFTIVELE